MAKFDSKSFNAEEFGKYVERVPNTKKNELVRVKTTNMGSMFRLTYNITLRDASKEKEMIDRLRERNGNLEIMVSKLENRIAEL